MTKEEKNVIKHILKILDEIAWSTDDPPTLRGKVLQARIMLEQTEKKPLPIF